MTVRTRVYIALLCLVRTWIKTVGLKFSLCSFYKPQKVLEAFSSYIQFLRQMLMIFGGLIFRIFLSHHKQSVHGIFAK